MAQRDFREGEFEFEFEWLATLAAMGPRAEAAHPERPTITISSTTWRHVACNFYPVGRLTGGSVVKGLPIDYLHYP